LAEIREYIFLTILTQAQVRYSRRMITILEKLDQNVEVSSAFRARSESTHDGLHV
jgi:hypothetical protein